MISNNLDPELTLESIAYSNENDQVVPPRARSLQQNSLYLPLEVTVSGSPDAVNNAHAELLSIAEDFKDEILDKLKDYNSDIFGDVDVSSEAIDAPDVAAESVITSHSVQFFLNRVEPDYELSKAHRQSFVDFVKKALQQEMKADTDRELIQAAHASRLQAEQKEPSSVLLPIRISIKGPLTEEKAAVNQYLMDILDNEGMKQNFEAHLKSMSRAFEEVFITYEAVDLPPVEVPTFVSTTLVPQVMSICSRFLTRKCISPFRYPIILLNSSSRTFWLVIA